LLRREQFAPRAARIRPMPFAPRLRSIPATSPAAP
jgi:hypothetical protein